MIYIIAYKVTEYLIHMWSFEWYDVIYAKYNKAELVQMQLTCITKRIRKYKRERHIKMLKILLNSN